MSTRPVPGPAPMPILGRLGNLLRFVVDPIGYAGRLFDTYGRLLVDHFKTLSVARDEHNLQYGKFDRDHAELCHRVQSEYDLQLDPIYGGKSFRTLEQREQPKGGDKRPVLFWHCGYTANWQCYQCSE